MLTLLEIAGGFAAGFIVVLAWVIFVVLYKNAAWSDWLIIFIGFAGGVMAAMVVGYYAVNLLVIWMIR